MFKAISFGVFWRSAPSTSAIMRSRNVSPGFEVMRTTIWSDRTRVPPVTAERSPPDSRMTGADSPVMADSSTDAIPSITSPSPGISSPAGTTHSSPTASRMIAGSNIEVAARVRTFGGRVVGSGAMVSGTVVTTGPSELSDEMLDNGAEGDDREVGEADDDHDHAGEQGGEQRPVGRE